MENFFVGKSLNFLCMNSVDKKLLSRRSFFKKGLKKTIWTFSFFVFPIQCSPKKETTTVVDPCQDLSSLSEAELKTRKGFNYVQQSPQTDMQCGNCNLFLPPGPEKKCGGCLLFKGPVNETGYCTYWAPQPEKI